MNKYKYNKSAELLVRAKKVLAGGVSSEFRKYNHPHAIFYHKGEGSKVYDVDGNEYLDFTLSQGPLILGHSHPEVLAAVEEYSRDGQLYAGQHIREIELAEKLNSLIPSAELLRFCLDGSEAVHIALRLARAKTNKTKFIRFEGHYHGWLDNVSWGISTKNIEDLGNHENPNVFAWSQGLPPQSKEESIVLPWNNLELLKKVIKQRHHEIACIITEPIMCNNGCVLPKKDFLEGLRALCDEFKIALIFDEVITGFRLSLGGAQEYFGITPDISVFAKAMASGYPISAVTGKKEWMRFLEDGTVIQAGTMNSSNPTVAAALATISVLEKCNPYPRMHYLGNKLRNGIKDASLSCKHKVIVQGIGPILNISFNGDNEITDYRGTLSSDKRVLTRFISEMHDRGIRIIGRGLWYISAVHTEEEINRAILIVNEVLSELD